MGLTVRERFISGCLHALSPASLSLFSFFKRPRVRNLPDRPSDPSTKLPSSRDSAKCRKACKDCMRPGCCFSCAYLSDFSREKESADSELQLCFWCRHDFQPSAFSVDLTRPLTATKRRFKVGYPALPDGRPCPYWKRSVGVG